MSNSRKRRRQDLYEQHLTFNDAWIGPFHYDGWGYIYDSENTMVFTFECPDDEEELKMHQEFANKMVNVLNGLEVEPINCIEIQDGVDLYKDGKLIGCFRGWGHLTGTGAMSLSSETAKRLQDSFIEYVMNKLKNGKIN